MLRHVVSRSTAVCLLPLRPAIAPRSVRFASKKPTQAAGSLAPTSAAAQPDSPPAPSSSQGQPDEDAFPPANSKYADETPAAKQAFFIALGRRRRAEKERQREANLIIVPVATGKEVQYATREAFEKAQEEEKELKRGRVRRAAELFGEGKLPKEIRSLVGGRKKPFALSTVRRYLLDHAVEDAKFKELLALNWARFTYDDGEYSDAADVEEALRRVRIERGEEKEYRRPAAKPKTDKWQRK